MEDAHTILLSMPNEQSTAFFAVFDGHGGAKVANYASENLYQLLSGNSLYRSGQTEEALKEVFIEFDEMMFNDEKMRDELAGSTAVVLLVRDGKLYCANIGDSRAVSCVAARVDALSVDHKPTCQGEHNRIVAAGGWVQFNRVNGNLALSRAFGDFVFKRNEKRTALEQIVTAYPDVQTRPLVDELEFVVLACDGVWDVMSNFEVVDFIRRRLCSGMAPQAICEELITRCLAPDCQMGSGIGCDNMTVILICYLNGSTYEQYRDRLINRLSYYSDNSRHNSYLERHLLHDEDCNLDSEIHAQNNVAKKSSPIDGKSRLEVFENNVSGTSPVDSAEESSEETSSVCSYDEMFAPIDSNTGTLNMKMVLNAAETESEVSSNGQNSPLNDSMIAIAGSKSNISSSSSAEPELIESHYFTSGSFNGVSSSGQFCSKHRHLSNKSSNTTSTGAVIGSCDEDSHMNSSTVTLSDC